jgi:CRISPR system Cascade subunit CasA
MNLLTSAWIPIRESGQVKKIGLKELLCNDEDTHLSLYRDDMETAALQLLISLVQALFMPRDGDVLRRRIAEPVSNQEYESGVSSYKGWFELDHPDNPFMQSRGVKAKEATSIQKLFIGLPEGNNHAFFNAPGEIGQACPSCTAIALFNQASNCPSFGGGFKANLRGSAPVSTFVMGGNLRSTLWLNVLTADFVDRLLPDTQAENRPTWVKTIKAGESIRVSAIGLTRGLFWQPARVELIGELAEGVCDSCQTPSEYLYTGLKKEKFVYSLDGLWQHPHSPQIWNQKKDGSMEKLRFISFTTNAPAWTQLNQYLVNGTESIPAHVVTQFKTLFPLRAMKMNLFVSGYRNKQASILMRRHELFSIPSDWEANDVLVNAINHALRVREVLRRKLYGFSKEVGANVHESAQQQFDRRSEPLIHSLLRDMGYKERVEAITEYKVKTACLARELLEQVTAPYRHGVAGMQQYVKCKCSFNNEVVKL